MNSRSVTGVFMPGDAPEDCRLCPRLVGFRRENRKNYPDFYNGPVPSAGDPEAQLLIVGLAPGLKGANRTARPFTGDSSGDLLYATLAKFGYCERDGGNDTPPVDMPLKNVMITNAVRCVPPQNKTTAAEEKNCRPFLINRISHSPRLKIIFALGLVAHNAILSAFGQKRAAFKFAHGARHALGDEFGRHITLIDSYHCSRYNINTGRLTAEMFADVFRKIDDCLT